MDINALVQNFRESQKGREVEVEEEKCRMKTYRDAVKSLEELQEFTIQWNDSDMFSVIAQGNVSVESRAARRVNCMQKSSLSSHKTIKSECHNFLCPV
jgi:hypothetical protein